MYSHMALMIVFNIPGLKNPVYHRIAVKCCPRIRWPRLNLNKATWKLLIFNTIGRFLLLSFFPLPSALLGGMFSFNKITRNGTFSVLEKIGDLSLWDRRTLSEGQSLFVLCALQCYHPSLCLLVLLHAFIFQRLPSLSHTLLCSLYKKKKKCFPQAKIMSLVWLTSAGWQQEVSKLMKLMQTKLHSHSVVSLLDVFAFYKRSLQTQYISNW